MKRVIITVSLVLGAIGVLAAQAQQTPAQGRGRGDLRAELVVEVPTKLSEQEAELLRQLAELRGEEVGPGDKGLFSRIKSAFQ